MRRGYKGLKDVRKGYRRLQKFTKNTNITKMCSGLQGVTWDLLGVPWRLQGVTRVKKVHREIRIVT